MRYVGDLVLPALPPGFLSPGGPSGSPTAQDAAVCANLIQLAPQASDTQASCFADFVDATPYGGRQKMMRIGLGAAVGLVVGGIAGYLIKGRL